MQEPNFQIVGIGLGGMLLLIVAQHLLIPLLKRAGKNGAGSGLPIDSDAHPAAMLATLRSIQAAQDGTNGRIDSMRDSIHSQLDGLRDSTAASFIIVRTDLNRFSERVVRLETRQEEIDRRLTEAERGARAGAG